MRVLLASLVLVPSFFPLASFAVAGEVIKVSIADMTFSPAEVAARVGDTVEWANFDFVDHTATAENGNWDVALPAGKSGGVEMRHAGDIVYFCRFHPNMTGVIHVAR